MKDKYTIEELEHGIRRVRAEITKCNQKRDESLLKYESSCLSFYCKKKQGGTLSRSINEYEYFLKKAVQAKEQLKFLKDRLYLEHRTSTPLEKDDY